MKSLKTLGLFVGLMVASIGASAQERLSQLTSLSALRSWVIEQACSSELGAWNASMTVYNVGARESWTTNRTVGALMKFFTNTTLTVTIVNTLDPIYVSGVIYNAQGQVLLYGWGVTHVENGAVVPPSLVFKMEYQNIAIKMDGQISTAEFWHVGSDGQTLEKVALQVQGNTFSFPASWAGEGYVIVRMRDGTTRVYNLKDNGKRIEPRTFAVKPATATIENMISIKDPSGVYTNVVDSVNGVGRNQTYEIEFTSRSVAGISLTTTEGAKPIAYWVRLQGQQPVRYPAANGGILIPYNMPGVVYIWAEWNEEEFQEPEPYIYGGGVKGG